MPWLSSVKNAGFSASDKTWLPISEKHVARAIDTQQIDTNSVLSEFKSFIQYRKENLVLQSGDISFIETDNDNVLVFDRYHCKKTLRCMFNFSEKEQVADGVDILALESLYIPQ